MTVYLALAICFMMAVIVQSYRVRVKRVSSVSIPAMSVVPSSTIPKIVYMTTSIDLEKVPDLLEHFANDYEVRIYNDAACRRFLSDNWGAETLTRFNSLKKGAHKMDLWRYCMLYLHGGIYLDIKTVPVQPIGEIFDKENTWYTCLSAVRGCYQGIIATPPGNDILLDCIKKVMETTNKRIASDYLLLTVQMHESCQQVYNSPCDEPGLYHVCNKRLKAPRLVLFKEACSEDECSYTRHDRYGLCCNIRNQNGNHLFRTRHGQYPWKRLPDNKKSILTRQDIEVIAA